MRYGGQGLTAFSAHGSLNGMTSFYMDMAGNARTFQFGKLNGIVKNEQYGIYILNGCSTAPTLTTTGYANPGQLDKELDAQGALWSSVGNPVLEGITKAYLDSDAAAIIASTDGSDAGAGTSIESGTIRNMIENIQSIGDAFAEAQQMAGTSRAARTFYLVGDPTLFIW